MESGLKGVSRHRAHLFRDFDRSTRTDGLTQESATRSDQDSFGEVRRAENADTALPKRSDDATGKPKARGEVGVDVSPIPGDPHGTVSRMKAIEASAKASKDPSVQDLTIAEAAARIEAAARA